MKTLDTFKTSSFFTHVLPLVALASALSLPALADGATRVETRGGQEKIRVVPDQGLYSVDVDIWTNKGDGARYCIGEEIDISFRTNVDAWVAVFNTDTRGKTHRLFPNRYDSEHFVRGGKTYSLPVDGYSFRIEGPTGHESLKVVAATSRRELRRAVREVIFASHLRPATHHGRGYSSRFHGASKISKPNYTDRAYRGSDYANRHDNRGDNKIVIVPNDIAFDTTFHQVTYGCQGRPPYRSPNRPWRR